MSEPFVTPTPSLFERLGGKPAVAAVVDAFYERVLADPLLAPFFARTDMTAMRRKQAVFVTYAFGGAPSYKGRSLYEAHRSAVGAGLTDEHFDAVVGHLLSTLAELGVGEELRAEVRTIVESTREMVLGRANPAERGVARR